MTTLHHTGIIVNDLDAAMGDMSAALGLQWLPPFVVAGDVHTLAGMRFRKVRITYSTTGPHFVELIQQLDATAYNVLTGGPTIHHLGFVTNDLEGDMARLDAQGFAPELYALDGDGRPARMAFHQNHHGGLWIELVSADFAVFLDEWIAGGPPPAGSLADEPTRSPPVD